MINRVDMYYLASFTGRSGAKAKERPISDPPIHNLIAAGRWSRQRGHFPCVVRGAREKDVPEAATMVTAGIAYLPGFLVNRQTRHFLQAALRPLKKCMTKEMTAIISKR
jgi:hypothetical protein